MFVPEFPAAEIAGAAERDGTDVTENLPLPLRRLYGERRTAAVDQLTVDKTPVDKVEGQGMEMRDSRHIILDKREASYACFTAASASIVATSSGARWADKR